VVTVGEELLARPPVLDPDDPGVRELAHGPVDGVDRTAKTAREGGTRRHTGTRAVAVAQQQRVQPEGGVRDRRVDHPLGYEREAGFLDDKGAVEVVGGLRVRGVRSHQLTSR